MSNKVEKVQSIEEYVEQFQLIKDYVEKMDQVFYIHTLKDIVGLYIPPLFTCIYQGFCTL